MITPYLYLDYDRLLVNIEEIANLAKKNGTDLRPHCKSHKTVEIAKLQIEKGAKGITASTLKEAAMLAKAGISSITLAYPLVGDDKIAIYKSVSKSCDLRSIVLDYDHAVYLNGFFTKEQPAKVYLKVDTGLKRLGVQPVEIEENVARIISLDNIRLIGLLTHGGHSYKGDKSLKAVAKEEAFGLLSHNSTNIIVSCGSTPTAKELLNIEGVDEIRPGNYVFYDRTMLSLGVVAKEKCSLFIKTTILARYEDYLVIDAGSKALSSDSGVHGNKSMVGYGLVLENENLVIERLSEEHGIVKGEGIDNFNRGDELTIIPNHACSAVNLFDNMEVFKENIHIGSYKIEGRGH